MTDFIQLVKERRSASNFHAGHSIKLEEVKDILDISDQYEVVLMITIG